MITTNHHAHPKQKGVTLIFALIILLVLSLLALASVRGVALQERMATNLHDRDMAFQAAAAALKAAEEILAVNPEPLGMINCTLPSQECEVVPSSTFTHDNSGWINIDSDASVNEAYRAGIPQYYIQLVSHGAQLSTYGQNQSANNLQYGVSGGMFEEYIYRITARSSNPEEAEGRALVVLQVTIKQEQEEQ